MFKYEGSLYLLANAQCLIDEIDLVWEKLDEVNGDCVFMTSKFTIWKKQQAVTSLDSLGQFDKTSGEIPSLPTDDIMTDTPIPSVPTDDIMTHTLNEQYLSSGSKLLTFDAAVANAYIVKRDWEGLDDYLCKFVAKVQKTPDEVVMMHPGLFFIPRMERLLDMLGDQKFGEADSFYQNSIELFRGCQGRFAALDLVRNIDDLDPGVKQRSKVKAATRFSAGNTATRISDYIHLYFPSAIHQDDGVIDGVWQFAIRLPKPNIKGSYYGFRCLLCGWVTKGSYSLSHLKSHFLQSKEIRSCPRGTEDAFDRLRAIDGVKDLPCFEDIKEKFNKKKRSQLSYIVTWVPVTSISSTGPSPSTIETGKGKRPRGADSQSLDSQVKGTLHCGLNLRTLLLHPHCHQTLSSLPHNRLFL